MVSPVSCAMSYLSDKSCVRKCINVHNFQNFTFFPVQIRETIAPISPNYFEKFDFQLPRQEGKNGPNCVPPPDGNKKICSFYTHDEMTPCPSRKLEALRLKLAYACSSPVSNVFSSIIRIIIEISKYVKPVTIHVDRSPIDSSLRKY